MAFQETTVNMLPQEEESQDPFVRHRVMSSRLYRNIGEHQWPFIYSPEYNIKFWGLEKLHPFDAGKWSKIFDFLKVFSILNKSTVVEPIEANEEDLSVVHTSRYLQTLKSPATVAYITEIWPLRLLPRFIVEKHVLKPFRYHTGGTIAAAQIALRRGWAINIGGGFHHCCAHMGGGFCAYADITLALRFLFERTDIPGKEVKKAMIVDLDAHQGNGHERDFMGDDRVYILDVFNADIYPRDKYAKDAIKKKVEVHSGIGDHEYMSKVRRALDEALTEFSPDIVVYNAGTDILSGDPLGLMDISKECIIERDEYVFKSVRRKSVPIIMVTSGGYQKSTAKIIAESIRNLIDKKLIDGPELRIEQQTTKPKTWSRCKCIAAIMSLGVFLWVLIKTFPYSKPRRYPE